MPFKSTSLISTVSLMTDFKLVIILTSLIFNRSPGNPSLFLIVIFFKVTCSFKKSIFKLSILTSLSAALVASFSMIFFAISSALNSAKK